MNSRMVGCLLFMATVFVARPVFATTYFVDDRNGDDQASGVVERLAWRSVERVNAADLRPGDIVRFKCGGEWRERLNPKSGEPGRPITYASYGTGEKPKFMYCKNVSCAEDWFEVTPGVWSTVTNGLPCDVGNIIFDEGRRCGRMKYLSPKWTPPVWKSKRWVAADRLVDDLDYYNDVSNGLVIVKTAVNPAHRFKSIELALGRTVVQFHHGHDIVFDGLHVTKGGMHGFQGAVTKRLTFRNCDVSWIGGKFCIWLKNKDGSIFAPERLGNGIEFFNNCDGHLIENCRIWEVYDAALTNQGREPHDQRNITYRNNRIWNSEYSFEYWCDGVVSNIVFEKNICLNAGGGWAHAQRPNPNGSHVLNYPHVSKSVSDIVIRDNVFSNATEWTYRFGYDWRSALKIYGNKVCFSPGRPAVFWTTPENEMRFYGPGDYQEKLGFDLPRVDSTADLQDRINRLSDGGGGTLTLTSGVYRTGALFFRPGVNLHLDKGAAIVAIDSPRWYPVCETRIEGETCQYCPAVINVDRCDGFRISGEGTIDGHGLPIWKAFWDLRKRNPNCTNKELKRPRLLYVSNSKNVDVSGVTFKNSKFWTTHYYRCGNLSVHDCRIVSETIGGVKGPSTDAIDLDNCQNVKIRRVRMDVNDDGIAVKGGKGPWADDPVKCPGNGPTENVVIEDCTFGSGCHSCLTLGSECPAATNVMVRNCRVEQAGNVLNLKMRTDTPQRYHGIVVSNVSGHCHAVMNIRAWNQFFDLKGRKNPPKSYASDIHFVDCSFECAHVRNVVKTPEFEVSDVVFSNVKATGTFAWPEGFNTPEDRLAALRSVWHVTGESFVQDEDGLFCTPMSDGKRKMRWLENRTGRAVSEIVEGYVSVLDPTTGRIEATDEVRVEPGASLYVVGDRIWRRGN